MLKPLLFFITLLSIISFKPGEPTATLTCKSESGRTTFTAELNSCSYLGSAEFSIDGVKYSFSVEDICGVIFDPENKVFTIHLETGKADAKQHRFLHCWAIPNTFKKTKSEKGAGSQFHDVYEFRCKIYGTEPRKGFENNTKIIELVCTLDYEL
jgi:hypothetical protein